VISRIQSASRYLRALTFLITVSELLLRTVPASVVKVEEDASDIANTRVPADRSDSTNTISKLAGPPLGQNFRLGREGGFLRRRPNSAM